ncbi:MAG: translation initiation factor [Chloroflexota bacterium]|nr:translation initiation factor [Chloroflexota bacterium]
MIRIPQVRVVDEEGAQLGVMATPEALTMAQDRGLDLVEVAPMASPPVVKFLDFGQYKYELTKRDKEAKRKQRSVTFKEVRLKPKIGIGDFDTKVRRAIEFLEEGDRIKVAVQFRGRELTHPEIGRSLLTRFAEQIKEHGVVERAPLLEGKSMHITVASSHKPKVIEHVDKHGREPVAGGSPAEPAVAVPAAAQAEPAVAAPAEPAAAPAEPAVAAPAAPAARAATAQTTEPPVAPVAAPVVEPKATEPEVAETKAAETKAAPAKTPERKPVAAKTTGTKTTRTKTTETAKPASRPTRSRKTAEPEASAPAPAGE